MHDQYDDRDDQDLDADLEPDAAQVGDKEHVA
jgi:hypothetical protein